MYKNWTFLSTNKERFTNHRSITILKDIIELSKSSTLISNLWQDKSENKASKPGPNIRQNKQLRGSRQFNFVERELASLSNNTKIIASRAPLTTRAKKSCDRFFHQINRWYHPYKHCTHDYSCTFTSAEWWTTDAMRTDVTADIK